MGAGPVDAPAPRTGSELFVRVADIFRDIARQARLFYRLEQLIATEAAGQWLQIVALQPEMPEDLAHLHHGGVGLDQQPLML